MIYKIGPQWVKVYYTSNGHNHVMTLPVQAQDEWGISQPLMVLDHTGLEVDLQTAMTAFLNTLKAVFNTADTVTYWEAWEQTEGMTEPVCRETTQVVGWAGTSNTADAPFSQIVMTFRDSLSHLFKLYLMETIYEPDRRMPGSTLSNEAPLIAIKANLISDDSIVYSRANNPIETCLHATTKVNDALRKKFLLS